MFRGDEFDALVPTLSDRKVGLRRWVTENEATVTVTHAQGDERAEQFAFVRKDDLLDALAQIGWLPDEYRKPKPLSPREAKIREVAMLLVNTDRQAEGEGVLTTYEDLKNDRYTNEDAYRQNAEALIDAGLVKIDG